MPYPIRLTAVVATSAVIATMTGAFLMVAYDYFAGPPSFGIQSAVGGWLFFSLITFPLVLAGIVLIGLPVDWLLARFGLESVIVYGVAGTFTGLVVDLLLLEVGLPIGALFGALASVSWWLLSRVALDSNRRPVRTP